MPHNPKEPETQREDQHSVESPTDPFLWSTQGKVYLCVYIYRLTFFLLTDVLFEFLAYLLIVTPGGTGG